MNRTMLIVLVAVGGLLVGLALCEVFKPKAATPPVADKPASETTPATPPAPVTVPQASPPQPSPQASHPQATPIDGQANASCCDVVPSAELKGRMGRLVVAYPQGANINDARTNVYKARDSQVITGGYGNQTLDLLPGTYAVVISGKRVEGVPIQSGHDTKIRVGVLNVHAGKDARVNLLDPSTKANITGGYGSQQFGLPIGTVLVSVAGQSEAVTIKDGQITDF